MSITSRNMIFLYATSQNVWLFYGKKRNAEPAGRREYSEAIQ